MIADLHVHSRYSFDSVSSPKAIVKIARRRLLDAVAVTDHNTIRGALEAREWATKLGLNLIIGEEVATDAGDMLCLFLDRQIKPGPFQNVVDQCREQGGMLVLPHPYRAHDLEQSVLHQVEAVETFNARTKPADNAKAARLSLETGKPGVASSDAHFACEVGNAVTVWNGEDLRSEIRRGEVTSRTRYNSPVSLPASQIIRSIKHRELARLPIHAAWLFARVVGCDKCR